MGVVGINLGTGSCCVIEGTKRPYEVHPIVSKTPEGKFSDGLIFMFSTIHLVNRASQAMRILGRKFSDPELQSELGFLPFRVIESPEGYPLIHGLTEDRGFTPIEILAMLISHLLVEKYSSHHSDKKYPLRYNSYCIAVPTYFTDQQKQDVLAAAKLAGLKSTILLDETTAIAMAYPRSWSFDSLGNACNVVFVDIGHASIQICFAEVKGPINVFYKAYMRSLGGRDFDMVLFKHFAYNIAKEYGIDVYKSSHDCVRLLDACERLKMNLSKYEEASYCIQLSNRDIRGSMKREVFEKMSTPILNKIKAALENALRNSGLNTKDPLSVEVVGNACSVPAIVNIFREVFRTEPRKMTCSEEYVVRGCANKLVEKRHYLGQEHPVYINTAAAANLEFVSSKLAVDWENGEDSQRCLWIRAMEKQGHPLIALNRNLIKIRGQKIMVGDTSEKSISSWKGWPWRAHDVQHVSSVKANSTKNEHQVENKRQNEQSTKEEDKSTSEHSEDQKLSDQLIAERNNARKEEFHKLKEDTTCPSECVEYFTKFRYSELQDATNNFDQLYMLGQGGFGIVYKGILLKTTVAIKILKDGSSQGTREFNMEVEILSKVRHPYLVTLIGACAENRALVYEYLPNGSLEDRLKCKNNTPPLSWQNRVRIAFEICSALNFLHCSKPHGIAHGDLKPDNILLDSNDVSKISDFGLCRQLNWIDSASVPFHITDNLNGTLAYMDPDYLSTGKMTPQYDVYAFGIILLRMATGKHPRGIRNLVEEAQKKRKLKTLVDSSAGAWPFKEAMKMISLGLRCSHPIRKNRPNLSKEVLSDIKSIVDVASASVPSLFSRLVQHR